MRWTAVRWGMLLVGLASCGESRNESASGEEGSGQAKPSRPDDKGAPPHEGGTGGKAGSGGAGGGISAVCPAGGMMTCPGTTSGRWCVETFSGPAPIEPWSVWSDRPDNAWVVGWRTLANGERDAVLMHWNGCAWTNVPNPDPARFQYARGVWGVAPNDLWIVGVGVAVLHFDGQALTPVAVPVPEIETVVDIGAASGTASNDVWTSGRQVLHWDGAAWTAATIDTGDPNQYFADVWAVAPNDVWVTGTRVAAHFNGSSWTVDQVVTGPMGLTAFLFTIWSSGPEAWAAGPGGRIHHFQNGQWTLAVAPDDAGPLLYDLGGLNGEVHLVGTQNTLRILENDTTFVQVADAPPQGTFYQGVWVSPSQVWAVASTSAGEAVVIRRAR